MACGCIGRCRSCGARILWVKTEAGRSMPVDAEPSLDGNIRLTPRHAVVMGKDEADAFSGPKRKTHFATCPQADGWRKDGHGKPL